MTKIKQFFGINDKYKFEWNDLRCLLTVINVILIMTIGFQVAWFGLTISVLGFVRDMIGERRVSGTIMHLSTIVLNGYFVYLNFVGQTKGKMLTIVGTARAVMACPGGSSFCTKTVPDFYKSLCKITNKKFRIFY